MASAFAPAIEALEAALRRSAPFRTWLRGRRWCGEGLGTRAEVAVRDLALLQETRTEALVLVVALAKEDGASVLLHLPFSVARARFAPDAFELAVGPNRYYVVEAERRETYARFLLERFRGAAKLVTRTGDELQFQGEGMGNFRSFEPPAGDSSNVVLRVVTSTTSAAVKSYKFLDPQNREPAILERLHRRRFAHAPRLLGQLSLGRGEDRLVLSVATGWIDATDLFTWLVQGWRDAFQAGPSAARVFEETTYILADDVGESTASLHEALVDRRPGPFQAEPFTLEDARTAYRLATRYLSDSIRMLAHRDRGDRAVPPELASESRSLLLDHRRDIEDVLAFLEAGVGTVKSVTHADLHLGQVLRTTEDGALTFIDFEGEPERAPAQRSVKLPPLRDVATLIRSFAYVSHTAWREAFGPEAAWPGGVLHPEELPTESREAFLRLQSWEAAVGQRVRDRYLARTSLYPELERDTAERVIRGWAMEKALYELRYELKHRPGNIAIPLDGVLSMAGVRG